MLWESGASLWLGSQINLIYNDGAMGWDLAVTGKKFCLTSQQDRPTTKPLASSVLSQIINRQPKS